MVVLPSGSGVGYSRIACLLSLAEGRVVHLALHGMDVQMGGCQN